MKRLKIFELTRSRSMPMEDERRFCGQFRLRRTGAKTLQTEDENRIQFEWIARVRRSTRLPEGQISETFVNKQTRFFIIALCHCLANEEARLSPSQTEKNRFVFIIFFITGRRSE